MCRDLSSMSRPDCLSFLPHSVSRPQKHVATSFLLSATNFLSQLLFSCSDLNCLSVHYLVVTWDLGRDLIISFPC